MSEENPIILPTIGRIVHYVSYGSADGTYPSVCRAAVVAEIPDKVWDDASKGHFGNDSHVNLCVLNPTGIFFGQSDYAEPEEKKGGTWHWPFACGQGS